MHTYTFSTQFNVEFHANRTITSRIMLMANLQLYLFLCTCMCVYVYVCVRVFTCHHVHGAKIV
jgi:hypothetical protein